MSTVSGPPSTTGGFAGPIPSAVLDPILNGFASSIREPLGFALINAVMGSWLIALLVALFYFSTPSSRKQVIFILNIISVLLGIGYAIWSSYVDLWNVFHPTGSTNTASLIGSAIVLSVLPWFSELILAFRLLAVFPPRSTKRSTLIAIFIFPVIVKTVRLTAVICFFHTFWNRVRREQGTALELTFEGGFRTSPWPKVEWFLQIFDNAYLSTIFIWKLYSGHIFGSADLPRMSLGINGTVTSRLKIIFWVAVENFVFPLLYNVTLIVDVYVDPHYLEIDSSLKLVGVYVTSIGVVFATVWSSSYTYKTSKLDPAQTTVQLKPVRPVQSADSTSTTWAEQKLGRPDRFVEDPALSIMTNKNYDWEASPEIRSQDNVIPLRVMVEQTTERGQEYKHDFKL